MKAENNPYFKNKYKPSPLWKVILKALAIPFLYLYAVLLKLCIFFVRYFRWFVSLFTNKPIWTGRIEEKYWIKGKKKTKMEIHVYKCKHDIEYFINSYFPNDSTRNKK